MTARDTKDDEGAVSSTKDKEPSFNPRFLDQISAVEHFRPEKSDHLASHATKFRPRDRGNKRL